MNLHSAKAVVFCSPFCSGERKGLENVQKITELSHHLKTDKVKHGNIFVKFGFYKLH